VKSTQNSKNKKEEVLIKG